MPHVCSYPLVETQSTKRDQAWKDKLRYRLNLAFLLIWMWSSGFPSKNQVWWDGGMDLPTGAIGVEGRGYGALLEKQNATITQWYPSGLKWPEKVENHSSRYLVMPHWLGSLGEFQRGWDDVIDPNLPTNQNHQLRERTNPNPFRKFLSLPYPFSLPTYWWHVIATMWTVSLFQRLDISWVCCLVGFINLIWEMHL